MKPERGEDGQQEYLSIDSLLRPLTPTETRELVDFQIKRTLADQAPFPEGEIIFTDKKLIRMVAGHPLTYSFIGKKKRLELFESLIGSLEYHSTRILQGLLGCRTPEALRKLIGTLNRDVMKKLQIKNQLIENQRGFGYRLNKNISITKG